MKVKNVMFTGFAAAILGGACGAADAATYTLASKDFVEEQVKLKQDKLTAGDGINIAEDNTISAQFKTAGGETVTMGDLADSIGAVDQKIGDLGENETVAGALAGKQDTLDNATVLESITQQTIESIGTTAGAVADLEATVGEVTEGKTVVQMIEEATYDDTALAGRVTGLETEVGDVPEAGWQIGTTTAKNIASAVEALRVKTENVATTEGLGQIESKIATLDGDVSTEGSVKYQVNAALDAAKQYADENDANTIYDDTALAGRVTALEGAGYLTEATADTMYDGIGAAAAVQNELDTYKQTVSTELAGKQATITDLDDIRSGAALGATALQSIEEGSVTKAMLDTSVQGSLDKADSAVQPAAIENMLTTTVAAETYATKTSLNNYVTNETLTQAGYQNAEQVQEKIDAGKFLTSDQLQAGTYLVSTDGSTVSYTSVAVVGGDGKEMNLTGGTF